MTLLFEQHVEIGHVDRISGRWSYVVGSDHRRLATHVNLWRLGKGESCGPCKARASISRYILTSGFEERSVD